MYEFGVKCEADFAAELGERQCKQRSRRPLE